MLRDNRHWIESAEEAITSRCQVGKLQAEADRAEAVEKKRANEIQIQMAQIEAEQAKDQAKIQADKEVALNELELQAPAQAQTSSSAAAAPPPTNMSPEATLLYRPEG